MNTIEIVSIVISAFLSFFLVVAACITLDKTLLICAIITGVYAWMGIEWN